MEWHFVDDSSAGRSWATYPDQLVAHVDYRRSAHGDGRWRRIIVVTKSWVAKQIEPLHRDKDGASNAVVSALLIVPDGDLSALTASIESALDNVGVDAFAHALD